MDKEHMGYHGRISSLARAQIERLNTSLRAEAEVERIKESGENKEQYWVRFEEVTIEDVNAVLGIFQKVTGRESSPMDDWDFLSFCEGFKSDLGIGEHTITKDGLSLEARRRIGPNGEFFVRFKIPRVTGKNVFDNGNAQVTLQEGIDSYFLERNIAVPLRETF